MRSPRLLRSLVLASLIFAGIDLGHASAEHLRARDSVRGRDHDEAREGVAKGRLVPLGDVIRIVRGRYSGQLLDASLHELVPGQPVYRVLILMQDGRRVAVWVDARSGQILRVEGE
ncbi:MAG TPA: PepSY domain-containing protein [Alphaproteobacteria bacterium]|nr:PepSY domain-containing protein [Alphaproteobacteria bacterium]